LARSSRAAPGDSAGDPQTARQAHDLYRDFLTACRECEQLNFLQPGRFLNRGQAADASVLLFCPVQQLGGAVIERLGASAAESAYAAQKMARLGILAMAQCRPVDFKPGQIPSLRTRRCVYSRVNLGSRARPASVAGRSL